MTTVLKEDKAIPLCVDLDGTLINTDLLHESFIQFLKQEWWHAYRLPFWLFKGRAELKSQLAQRVDISIDRLPFNEDFLDYLTEQHRQERELILVTGSNQKYAAQIFEKMKIFSGVIASDDKFNCTSHDKAAKLTALYGKNGFDYAGNSKKDLPIWQVSRRSVVVNPSESTLHQANPISSV